MSKKSRTKGAGYERKIAEYLTKMTGQTYKKCPGSGAIGTLSGIEGLQGDIIRSDLKPIPYLECKKYKDFRLENFLLKQGDEWKWVQQTLKNVKGDRIWCIIFQKDYGRHHWLLTNFRLVDTVDQFRLYISTDIYKDWSLTTLDIAFKDQKFKELFL